MRVALVHDWLTGMRGGERVLQEIASLYPEADLFTLIHIPGRVSPEIESHTIHASPLSRLPGVARYYRWLLPLFPWAIRRFDLSGYDLVISISHAVAKGVRTGPGTAHLCYCLTPMRYIWDQMDAYLGRGLLRVASLPLVAALRVFDRHTASSNHVTRFTAISSVVRERIAAHYNREAGCVHPPVDTESLRPNDSPPEDFYLLVGAFVPYKGDALAIEAFVGLERRLVIAGDGPGRKSLMARATSNVKFLGHVSDTELSDLYARCRALIYPQEEDFGIIAVEAQAAGRPVIAFAKGGARDTVRGLVPHQTGTPASATGICFSPQTSEALCAAIDRFEVNASAFDSKAIRDWAEGFSQARFRKEFAEEVSRTLAEHGRRRDPSRTRFVLGGGGVRLVGIGVEEAAPECHEHDLDIQADRPIANVVEIVIDPLVDRGAAAPSVDLCPTREAGFHLVAQHVARDVVAKLFDEDRSFGPWTHEAHVSKKYIPELRQFVEAESPQEGAKARAARVLGVGKDRAAVRLCALNHRTELPHLKDPSIESHSLLDVEDWPSARQQDDHCNHQHDRDRDDKGRATRENVNAAFADCGPTH